MTTETESLHTNSTDIVSGDPNILIFDLKKRKKSSAETGEIMEDEYLEEEGNETLHEQEGFSVQFDVFPIILAVLIVLANGTALVLVARRKNLRSATNGVLASLAVSDFLAGFLGIPFYLVCNAAYDPSWCLCSVVFWRFVSVSTVLHLTILTLHLYATVVHVMRCKVLLRRNVSAGLVCAVWFCAAFVSLVQLSWITVENKESEEERQRVHLAYAITVLAAFLGVPLVTMIYCHVRIFANIRLSKREQTVGKLENRVDSVEDQTLDKYTENWKLGLVLLGMLAAFLICWVPYFVLELVTDTEGMGAFPDWAEYVLFYYTRFTASAINPVLFVIGKRDFRRAFCGCLGCSQTQSEDNVVLGTVQFSTLENEKV